MKETQKTGQKEDLGMKSSTQEMVEGCEEFLGCPGEKFAFA